MNNETIHIPGFPSVTRKQINKYLQDDIDDDWFQDPIRYADYIKLKKEIECITDNAKNNRGKYLPSKRELYFVPKSNFTVRYSLETDYYERWLYFYLVIPLVKKFDRLLPRQVYNHRYNSFDDRYLFVNRIQQWAKFEGVIRSQLTQKNKVLIEADVQNYYENIFIEFLSEDLKRCVNETALDLNDMKELNESVECIISCLKNWSYDEKRGIPQNRDCSSFLANIYMLSIDREMLNAGFEYYRYMDDIRIICDDVFQARRALLKLVNSLRDKMLSLNSKKTRIIEYGSKEYNERIKPNFKLQSIDLLLRTKRKANIAIGYSILKDILIDLLKDRSYDSKDFRFCVYRISRLARCKNYKLPNDYFNDIIDGVIDSLVACPTSTDNAFVFLSSVKLQNIHIQKITDYLGNKDHAIYEWQNYWLWKLLIIHGANNAFLLKLALDNIGDIERNCADKAGAILYIAKFGDKSHMIDIKDKMPAIDSLFLQRHCLFILKKLDWIRDVQSISGSINARLQGNYKVIKDHIKDIVLAPPSVSITEILESVHQYD